jgi:hypothetical protein
MSWFGRGTIRDGKVLLTDPVPLPEGTEVGVHLEPLGAARSGAPSPGLEEFATLPAFGMWADREDMNDSDAWVRQERATWHQRAARPD